MYKVKIIKIENTTHNVKSIYLEKPNGYKFVPGQAVDVSVENDGYKNDQHPFTFTSLNEDNYLQFTIKEYKGITKIIHRLKVGDEIEIGKPFGTINYKGKGVFVAGGAGITPFVAIFKDLISKYGDLQGNKLIYTNKLKKDIIFEKWLKKIFPHEDLTFTLTQEKLVGYYNERIDKKFLEKHVNNWNQYFYICGKGSMIRELKAVLPTLGVYDSKIIYEK